MVAPAGGSLRFGVRSFHMKKFACAAVLTLALVGAAVAADVTVTATITRVDKKGEGDKVEYTIHYKTFPKKKGEKVEPVTRAVAKNCVVARGKLSAADPKKVDQGESIENGLANPLFPTKEGDKQTLVRMTFDDDKGTITHILVLPIPGKKGAEGK